MALFKDREPRVIVQGITGRHGRFHTRQMLDCGTRVVAGVSPYKGGTTVEGVPVFASVERAAAETGADASILFVPPAHAADGICEAAEAGIPTVVCITEGIPVGDMVRVKSWLRGRDTRLIGPNCPGVMVPGRYKLGIMPAEIHRPGQVAVLSRSGTLTYEVVAQLSALGLGQSLVVGIGGDMVVGTDFADLLPELEADENTAGIVLIGEIGGQAEERAAELIAAGRVRKPVVAYVAGITAPPGKRMGHAGAIISGGRDTAGEKMRLLREAGVLVASRCTEVGELVRQALRAD